MVRVIISEEVKSLFPDFRGGYISAVVKNSQSDKQLWEEIDICTTEYKSTHKIDDIKNHPVISATRAAYKSLGKDPNRYRPSSEALYRRILRDLQLYKVNTLVDIINLVSIYSGYSIGGFDEEKIEGHTLTMSVGKVNEPYDAIGRGIMNIEGLPVYRDVIGGVGTPTSDNERTKISLETKQLFAVFNGFNGSDGLSDAMRYMQSLLEKYVNACKIESGYF